MAEAKILKSPTALLSASYELYTQKFKTIARVMLPPTFLTLLLTLTGLNDKNRAPQLTAHNPGLTLLGAALTLVSIVVWLWAVVALFYVISEKIDFQAAYRKAWEKLPSYFGVSLVAGLAILGGSVFLIIPGIIFYVWFVFATYVLVFEKKGIIESLKQSKKYVQGAWFAVAGRLLVGLLALFLAAVVVSLMAGIINILRVPLLPDVISALGQIFMTPFYTIYLYFLYKELK